MVRRAYDTEEYDKAVHYTSEMLRLCPRDNLGVRDWLPSLLLQACRPSDALSFVQQWSTPAAQKGELLPGGGTHFATPSQEPLSDAEVERQIKGWAHPQIMYSGALAAFQLWGDCELARQYLSIARSHNSHVLIRILSRQSVRWISIRVSSVWRIAPIVLARRTICASHSSYGWCLTYSTG
ncbi:hypothetical protein FRB95_005772 [Tulasnella sp. JGI-2019a]|nr:hypothetical protein FRB95_005772 [Tulasnella sp. JGI-2019a]